MRRLLCVSIVALVSAPCAAQQSMKSDSYDLLLHSPSRAVQREALSAILRQPQDYLPRIRESLRDYPRSVRTDWQAANRAVHVAALVRDASFAPILVSMLGDSAVVDECIYTCPVVFTLTIFSSFGGWTLPAGLDSSLTTVTDLQAAVRYMPRVSLDVRPIDKVVQGPAVERHRKAIEGKTEEQLIEMAASRDGAGWLAPFALESSVATSKSRIELFLLLMNESRSDASKEYRGSIYQAIYRAETAKARGR
jgi:hypothetical protein